MRTSVEVQSKRNNDGVLTRSIDGGQNKNYNGSAGGNAGVRSEQ